MSAPRDLSRHDERALDLLRRNRAGSEDWLYVAGALLRLIEAQGAKIDALERLLDELMEPVEQPKEAEIDSSRKRG